MIETLNSLIYAVVKTTGARGEVQSPWEQ